GIGVIDSLSRVEPVGVADTIAAVAAFASALVAVGALWLAGTQVTTTSPPRRLPAAAGILAVLALTVPGLVASADHDADGHSHGTTEDGHDDGDPHDGDDHGHEEPTGLAADPIFAGADTTGI